MATAKEKTDIALLQKDVAVMQNDINYIKSGQDALTKKIDGLSYASIADVEELKKKVAALEEYNVTNKVGTVFSNLLASKAFTFVIGLIFAAIMFYLVRTGGK